MSAIEGTDTRLRTPNPQDLWEQRRCYDETKVMRDLEYLVYFLLILC